MTMTGNPFLDPAKEIIQGKSDEELLEELVNSREEPEQLPEAREEPEPQASQSKASPTSLNEDYIHIPAEAFKRLLSSPEYAWLGQGEGGLYLATKKLVVDSEVRSAAQDVKDLSGYQDGQQLGDLTWYEAKLIAKGLDGFLLTPAMLWCVVEHLEKSGGKDVPGTVLGQGEEWLDAIVEVSTLASLSNSIQAYTADASLYTHTSVTATIFDRQSGYRHLLEGDCRDTNTQGYFRLKDVVDHTGFPKKVGKKSKAAFFQGAPAYGTYAAVCAYNALTGIQIGGDYILAIDNVPGGMNAAVGMRLCKTPGQRMLDYLNRHGVPPPPGGVRTPQPPPVPGDTIR